LTDTTQTRFFFFNLSSNTIYTSCNHLPSRSQADKLSELLSKPVTFLPDCVGKETEEAVKNSKDGEIFLLENLRFHAEEEGSSKDSEGKKVKGELGVFIFFVDSMWRVFKYLQTLTLASFLDIHFTEISSPSARSQPTNPPSKPSANPSLP
jgi:hypothetical protein